MERARGTGLKGLRIVFTRPAGDGDTLRALLDRHGAELVEYPVLVIRPVEGEEKERLSRALRDLSGGAFDALLLTSQTAVQVIAPLLAQAGLSLAGDAPEVFAVGPKTAAAARLLGARPLVPELSTAEGLLATVRATHPELAGRSFLFPRARAGRLALVRGLEAAGARVSAPPAYDTLPAKEVPPLPADVDWVTFMSPSAVKAFLERATVPDGARVACICPTTAAAARASGLRVDTVPEEQSIEAMLAAMAE